MLGQVSTWMGDRLGTPGAVVFLLIKRNKKHYKHWLG